jgi:hypothetical protein
MVGGGKWDAMSTEPEVSLLAPPNQLMALSAALRQAAIDIPKDLPKGVRFSYAFESGGGHAVTVVVKATDHVAGVVSWAQAYTASGRRVQRVTVAGAVDF